MTNASSVDTRFIQLFANINGDMPLAELSGRIAEQFHCALALISHEGDVLASIGALPLSHLRASASAPGLDRPARAHAISSFGQWQLHERDIDVAESRYTLTLATHRHQDETVDADALAIAAAAFIAVSALAGTSERRTLATMSQILRDLERGIPRPLEHHYWPRMESLGFTAHNPVMVTVADPRGTNEISSDRIVELVAAARQDRVALLVAPQLVRTTSISTVHFITHANATSRAWLTTHLRDSVIAHSDAFQFLGDVPNALVQAESTLGLNLQIAATQDASHPVQPLHYAELPLSAWALAVLPRRELVERTQALVAPLADHPELRTTLVTYLTLGCRIPETAEALFLHPNSIRYRLQRIETLCHVALDDPIDRADITLACLPQLLAAD